MLTGSIVIDSLHTFLMISIYSNTVFIGVPTNPRIPHTLHGAHTAAQPCITKKETTVSQRGRSIRKFGPTEFTLYRIILLGQHYCHAIDDGIPESTAIFVHYSQAHIVPTDRPVFLWAHDYDQFGEASVTENTDAQSRVHQSICFNASEGPSDIYIIIVRAKALGLVRRDEGTW